MGGKTSTSTSSTAPNPLVGQDFGTAMSMIGNASMQPFQPYQTAGYNTSGGGELVAGINAEQLGGISNLNSYSNPISAGDINSYLNPYLQNVLGSTEALVNQSNQQAMAGQTGNAIRSGAFGGDRAGLAAAALAGQQELAAGKLYSGISSDAYNQAVATAAQQREMGIGQAEAQLSAGTLEQQTAQARDTALYNQYLQQRAYPFQVAAAYAGTLGELGGLMGGTSSTTKPGSLFSSDERLKKNIEVIGKTFDGQPIYKYQFKDGDPRTHIGLIAQDVEKHHPEAVGTLGGYKAVDYDKATEHAAHRGHFYSGGLVPSSMGGHVGMEHMREGYALGGSDLSSLLQSHQQMYGNMPGASGGMPGLPTGLGGKSGRAAVLNVSAPNVGQSPSLLDNVNQAAKADQSIKTLGKDLSTVGNYAKEKMGFGQKYGGWDNANEGQLANASVNDSALSMPTSPGSMPDISGGDYQPQDFGDTPDVPDVPDVPLYRGGVVGGRHGYALDGGVDDDMGSDQENDVGPTHLYIPTPTQAPAKINLNAPSNNFKTEDQNDFQELGQIASLAAIAAALARGGVAGNRHGYAVGGSEDDDDQPTGVFKDSSDSFAPPTNDSGSSDGYIPPEKSVWGKIKSGLASFGDDLVKYNAQAGYNMAQAQRNAASGLVGGKVEKPKNILDQSYDDATEAKLRKLGEENLKNLNASNTNQNTSAKNQQQSDQPTGLIQLPPTVAPPTPAYAADAVRPDVGLESGFANYYNPATPAAPATNPTGVSQPSADDLFVKPTAKKQYQPAEPSFWQKLSSGLASASPLLSGAAAAVSAQTSNPLTALAIGAGAAGQSALNQQKALADIEYTKANTGLTEADIDRIAASTGKTRAETAGIFMSNIQKAIVNGGSEKDPLPYIMLNNGGSMPWYDYIQMDPRERPPFLGQSQAFGAVNDPRNPVAKIPLPKKTATSAIAATPAGPLSPSPQSMAAIDRDALTNLQMSGSEGFKSNRTAARQRIADEASAAANSGTNLTNLAEAISTIPENSALQGNSYAQFFRAAALNWNAIMKASGAPQSAIFNEDEMNSSFIKSKILAGQSFLTSDSAGQHSLAALKQAEEAGPDKGIPLSVSRELAANMLVGKQKALDAFHFEQEAANRTRIKQGYNPNTAISQFRAEHNDEQYLKDRNALIDLMSRKGLLTELIQGRTSRQAVEQLLGAPNITRYLYNQ